MMWGSVLENYLPPRCLCLDPWPIIKLLFPRVVFSGLFPSIFWIASFIQCCLANCFVLGCSLPAHSLNSVFCFVLRQVLLIPGWSQTFYIAENALEFFYPPASSSWVPRVFWFGFALPCFWEGGSSWQHIQVFSCQFFSVDKLPRVQRWRQRSLEECEFNVSLTSCDIMAELFNLSELRCSHLYNGFVGNSIR